VQKEDTEKTSALNFKNDIAKIDGWLTKEDGTFLYQTAQKINPQGAIVEIGSWKGKSAICLGKGVQNGKRAKNILFLFYRILFAWIGTIKLGRKRTVLK